MRFEERIKREMKQLAAAGGHQMSRYQRAAVPVFTFRSTCANCPEQIELGFDRSATHSSFAPRGRDPFERCRKPRAH